MKEWHGKHSSWNTSPKKKESLNVSVVCDQISDLPESYGFDGKRCWHTKSVHDAVRVINPEIGTWRVSA